MFSEITKVGSNFSLALAMLSAPLANAAFVQNFGAPATLIAQGSNTSFEELTARGKSLRQSLDAKYRELESPGGPFSNSPGIKVKPFRNVDVSSIFWQHIDKGMPLNEVEIILKGAGFRTNYSRSDLPSNAKAPLAIHSLAGAINYLADTHWFTNVTVLINLHSDDTPTVLSLDADFNKQAY